VQSVSRDDVLHCAALAALDLDEAEVEPLRRDMEQLLAFAGRLDAHDLGDLDGAEPDAAGCGPGTPDAAGCGPTPDGHIAMPPLRRREDVALPSLSQAEALMNAAMHDRGCFVVPKIL
jgi:Asp-tRNA(Asn)/Glu-tRNA(Gln) amidotransferase C subunit